MSLRGEQAGSDQSPGRYRFGWISAGPLRGYDALETDIQLTAMIGREQTGRFEAQSGQTGRCRCAATAITTGAMGPFDGRPTDVMRQCDGFGGSCVTAHLQCRARAA